MLDPTKLDPKNNPTVDARELPRGLENMFRASFRPGANLTFLEQRSPGGLGSLGRRRFTAVETRKGVHEAREAKALVPSALYWWTEQDDMPSQTATLLQHAIRIPDPYFQVHDHWLIRQLAPDIAKIEMPYPKDKRLGLAPHLLRLMGRETANIHLGGRTNQDLAERLGNLDQNLPRWFPAATDEWSPTFAGTTRSGPNDTTTDCRGWRRGAVVSTRTAFAGAQAEPLRISAEDLSSRPVVGRAICPHFGRRRSIRRGHSDTNVVVLGSRRTLRPVSFGKTFIRL